MGTIFTLTLQDIQGTNINNDLYAHFDKLSEADNVDIYWSEEGPSYEPSSTHKEPPQPPSPIYEEPAQPPSSIFYEEPPQPSSSINEALPQSPMTLSFEEMSEKLLNYYEAGELKWHKLKDSMSNKDGWNEFCNTLWKKWRIDQVIPKPCCTHQIYLEPARPSLGITIKLHKGPKINGEYLICQCEDKITPEKLLDYFYVTRGKIGEYFIFDKIKHNSKVLVPIHYIPNADGEPQ